MSHEIFKWIYIVRIIISVSFTDMTRWKLKNHTFSLWTNLRLFRWVYSYIMQTKWFPEGYSILQPSNGCYNMIRFRSKYCIWPMLRWKLSTVVLSSIGSEAFVNNDALMGQVDGGSSDRINVRWYRQRYTNPMHIVHRLQFRACILLGL